MPPKPVPTGWQLVSSRRRGHITPLGTPRSSSPRGLRLSSHRAHGFSCASSWESEWTPTAAAVKSCNMDGGTDRAPDCSRVSPERFPRSHWNAQICIHGIFWLGALHNPLSAVERWAAAWAATSSICTGARRVPDPWSMVAARQHDPGTSKDPLSSRSSLSCQEPSRSQGTGLPCCSLSPVWSGAEHPTFEDASPDPADVQGHFSADLRRLGLSPGMLVPITAVLPFTHA